MELKRTICRFDITQPNGYAFRNPRLRKESGVGGQGTNKQVHHLSNQKCRRTLHEIKS